MQTEQTQNKRGCSGSCLGGTARLGAGLIILAIVSYFVLLAMGGILIIADPLEKADAVVVLSGGSGERIKEAARIYKEKNAQYIVLTQPEQRDGGEASPIVDMKLEIMKMEVPIGGILVTDTHGNSTYEEAKEIRSYLESLNMKRALIVTDPFHTFRTRLIFREVMQGSSVSVHVRPVRGHWYRSTTWWTSAEGWRQTLAEYAKIAAFVLGARSD